MKKNLLLLGGYGFISSNLIKHIDQYYFDKYNLIVFDRVKYHPHGIIFNSVSSSYAGDFSDEEQLDYIFNNHKIDIVLHFLSSTVPVTSFNAQFDVESNLVSTLRLLNIMKKHSVKDIVYLSSGGAIYGDYLEKVHNEEDAVYPKSSYGVVKLAIEKYLLLYSELYNFNSLILRLSNPYGPYHYNDKQGVINVAIKKALRGEELQIWGHGNGIKDYIYIEDVCDIIMLLVKDGLTTGVYNVASANALSVNDIVTAIKKLIPTFKFEYIPESVNDVQSFELDITRLRSKLGGYKMTPFEDAILKTIEWERTQLL